MDVAGTRTATTRCTLIVNQRFCARVWMTNVPLDLFTYRFPVTENHSKKTYENRQRSSGIFSWHVVANYALSAVSATSPDSMLAQISDVDGSR